MFEPGLDTAFGTPYMSFAPSIDQTPAANLVDGTGAAGSNEGVSGGNAQRTTHLITPEDAVELPISSSRKRWRPKATPRREEPSRGSTLRPRERCNIWFQAQF